MEKELRQRDTIELLWSLRKSRVALLELTRRAVKGAVLNSVKAGIYLNHSIEGQVKKKQ